MSEGGERDEDGQFINTEEESPQMADEDKASDEGAKGVSRHSDAIELKGSFEQQQAIIGQLREALKTKINTKEQDKGNDDYATRLAKMKPRLIRGRGRGRSKAGSPMPSSPTYTPAAAGSSSQKLLKDSTSESDPIVPIKNIDESIDQSFQPTFQSSTSKADYSLSLQAISERRSRSARSSVSSVQDLSLPTPQIESNSRAKLLLLRKQCEENRIKFDRQQRENAEKRATMDEMKDRIEKLRVEVEERDNLIESFQTVVPTDPTMQHLYQQILYKDNTIIDLTERLSHMEGLMQDQKEQLNEKSQIISARTEAVGLITKDKDEKLQTVVNELDVVRTEFFKFKQESVVNLEESHSREKELTSSLNEKNKRISACEDNYHRLESVRFELSARNAVLQEKIVSMQSDGEDVRMDLNNTKEELLKQREEVAELQRKLIRAEAFGQKKLKAFEKQLRAIEKESNLQTSLLQLQNQIAELEEEKGNLQLKLVDFDEMKCKNAKHAAQVMIFEQKVKDYDNEYHTQFSTISALEKEKINFVDSLNSKDLMILNLEECISRQDSEVEILRQQKVTLDLHICTIEEERDKALAHSSKIINETIDNNSEDAPNSLLEENRNLSDKISNLEFNLNKLNEEYNNIIKEMNKNEISAGEALADRDKKVEDNACLISLLAEKESTITNQSIDIENHETILRKYMDELQGKNELLQKQEAVMISLQNECQAVSSKLEESEAVMDTWEDRVALLQEELTSQQQMIHDLQTQERKLGLVIQEKNILVQNLEGEICSLNDSLELKERTIDTQMNKLENVDNLLNSREKEISQLRSEVQDSTEGAKALEKKNIKLEKDLTNIQTTLQGTISNLETELEILSSLISDKENRISTLLNEIEIKNDEIRNNQIMISRFEEQVCESNRAYDELVTDKTSADADKTSMQSQITSLQSDLESATEDIEGVQSLLREKESTITELKSELGYFLEKIDLLENQAKSSDSFREKVLEENNELKKCNDDKDYSIKNLHNEMSAAINIHKDESSNLASALIEKQIEIQQLQSSILSSTEESSSRANLIEKWQSEMSEKSQQLADAEERQMLKDQEMTELTHSIESLNCSLLTNQMEFSQMKENYENELQQLRLQSLQLQGTNEETQNLLKLTENNRMELEMRVREIESENEMKAALIIQLQRKIDSIQQKDQQHTEAMKENIQELYHQLSISNSHVSNLQNANTSLENVLSSERICIKELNSKIMEITALVGCKDTEIQSLTDIKLQLTSQLASLENSNENSSPTSVVLLLQEELSTCRNSLIETQRDLEKMTDKFNQLTKLESAKDNLVPAVKADTEYSELNTERDSLKSQLEDANQAIVKLETILATQSAQSAAKADDWEDWGEVDLGQPTTVSDTSLSIQASLLEKDKTLTVIQEQLKDALEEVNTVTDEKKLIEHQMKILEAELAHKDQMIESCQENVSSLELEKSTVLKDFQEMQHALQNTYAQIGEKDFLINQSQAKIDELNIALGSLHNELALSQSERQMTPSTLSKNSEEISSDAKIDETLVVTTSQQETRTETEDIEELKYKLNWYEDQWKTWTEHFNQIQASYDETQENLLGMAQKLKFICSPKEATNEEGDPSTIESIDNSFEKLDEELRRLRTFENENYQIKNHLQALEHQLSIQDKTLSDSQTECARLQSVEALYRDLQTSKVEAEMKCEGSRSRVQELELMVQCAESEISRLRIDQETLTTAGKALEMDRSGMVEEISNLREEIRKSCDERERFLEENTALQTQLGSVHSQMLEDQGLLERFRAETNQLRSELEVMEGENERFRNNYEILESETNRLRSDIEILTQNNHLTEAQKESLEIEVSRLNGRVMELFSEGDHLRGESQRLSELSTSAESEIARLKTELNSIVSFEPAYKELQNRYTELRQELLGMEDFKPAYNELQNRYTELQQHLLRMEESSNRSTTPDQQTLLVEEVDWGADAKIESEHLQRSESTSAALEAEILSLKDRAIALEKERNDIAEELQVSKIKNGKMIQKLKASSNKYDNLKKEFDKMKSKAGGFSDLDQALEEEWKALLSAAEAEKGELKIKVDELEKEKSDVVTRLDVFESAQERFFQMKESQDATVAQLSNKNRELESHVSSLEWKLSEYEERGDSDSLTLSPMSSDEGQVLKLHQKINELESNVRSLSEENTKLKTANVELESKVESLSEDNENFQTLLEKMRDVKNKAETDSNSYKASYMELYTDHETLKEEHLKTETESSQLTFDHDALNAAYDGLYEDYNNLLRNEEELRMKLTLCNSEKDVVKEEVDNLNKRLTALMEEEEEEIIRSLQQECSEHVEDSSRMKEEIILLTAQLELSEAAEKKKKRSLEKQVEVHGLLQRELIKNSENESQMNSVLEEYKRREKYSSAEVASLRSRTSQQQVTLEEAAAELKKKELKFKDQLELNEALTQRLRVFESSIEGSRSLLLKQQGEGDDPEGSGGLADPTLVSLHLKDLRCQQLSLEINKLLEERDALQLKLSAALSQQMPPPATAHRALKMKLDELRELNSNFEKRALDTINRGVLTPATPTHIPPSVPTFISHTAPPTPTATRQSDFTVTRENQGSSSTLFGWILGKSPPKEVLHI